MTQKNELISAMIRIAHITDLHISPDGSRVRDMDVQEHFNRVLDSVLSFGPDQIVIGGDLAAVEGEIESYCWVKLQLDRTKVPYLLIPGNHDIVDRLEAVFGTFKKDRPGWCFAKETEAALLIGLDSSNTSVSEEQLQWLKQTAAKSKSPILLFVHHPPLDCGCLFMDSRYPMTNREQVFEVIRNCPKIKQVFCGHYHTEKTIMKDDVTVFITPSTMLQISQSHSEYHLESVHPGWRLIELHSNQIFTRVIYPSC